eukprot:3065759-Rhodomonas_salina.1
MTRASTSMLGVDAAVLRRFAYVQSTAPLLTRMLAICTSRTEVAAVPKAMSRKERADAISSEVGRQA